MLYFNAQLEEFEAALSSFDKVSANQRLQVPAQLAPEDDWFLPNNTRYSPEGLKQLCDLLQPGYYRFLKSLLIGTESQLLTAARMTSLLVHQNFERVADMIPLLDGDEIVGFCHKMNLACSAEKLFSLSAPKTQLRRQFAFAAIKGPRVLVVLNANSCENFAREYDSDVIHSSYSWCLDRTSRSRPCVAQHALSLSDTTGWWLAGIRRHASSKNSQIGFEPERFQTLIARLRKNAMTTASIRRLAATLDEKTLEINRWTKYWLQRVRRSKLDIMPDANSLQGALRRYLIEQGKTSPHVSMTAYEFWRECARNNWLAFSAQKAHTGSLLYRMFLKHSWTKDYVDFVNNKQKADRRGRADL